MVTTTMSGAPILYMGDGSSLADCYNGGSDYRTVNHGDKFTASLATNGFCGNNISDACSITSIMLSVDIKLELANAGWENKCDCDFFLTAFERNDALPNGGMTPASGAMGSINGSLEKIEFSGYKVIATKGNSWKNYTKTWGFTGSLQANKYFPGLKLVFMNGNNWTNFRYWLSGIKLSIVRTRCCIIKFKGDGVTEKSTMYDYGTVPSYGSTPTRSGYTFKGWKSGSTTYSGTLPTAYEQDVTYTAVWEKIPCTITYNGNGATSGSVAAQSGYVGEAVTLAQNGFEKRYLVLSQSYGNSAYTNYSIASFQGWYTSASGGTKAGDGGASYTPSGNVTLYAHWSAMPAVTLPTPSRDGYTFLGWYTSAEGGTKVGDGGASYTPTGNIEIHAHWQANKINGIYIGTSQPKEIYVGSQKVKAVYVGTTKVYG